MRKVVLFMHLSLDGYAAGPKGELNWIPYDEESMNYADEVVSTVGSPIYGRVTFELMESYWPTVPNNPSSSKRDIDHANWYEKIEKIVISRSLDRVESSHTTLIKANIAEEIAKLKQQPGKDLVIFGSPSIARTFIELGLIDEYRLTISPVILGSGITVFNDLKDKINLKLLDSRTLRSGLIALHYQQVKG
ncbi:dihydrofolate reductase family protein [Cohnella silvisoli]|uniref:Dihydrofolate reductase family protein n=1 Tax=Cohnella silvisoli TaxID=2873699 RepID=A0ABV1KLC4_9BACL|nr:dihydrofolate reductase family protein [Cohnella silvisoli]MCD9020735.1 dihydrofolate reductase family protein [Cohnella silvisoli]